MNREAANATDYKIGRAEGIATALDEMTRLNGYLSSSDPEAHAITTLVLLLKETLADIAECHQAEWEAARATARAAETA